MPVKTAKQRLAARIYLISKIPGHCHLCRGLFLVHGGAV
ncbi:MAG: hypothetical protein R2860_04035 [Desulfobacterales bacterium]